MKKLDYTLHLIESPDTLSAVRDLRTGAIYVGRLSQAQCMRDTDYHPLVAERVLVEKELLRALRELCTSGHSPDAAHICERCIHEPTWLWEQLSRFSIRAAVGGLRTIDQAQNLAKAVVALEASLERKLSAEDWESLAKSAVHHPELVAVSDALEACEARSVEEMQHLELHVEAAGPNGACPRCLHCAFITHGVLPSPEQQEVEMLWVQRGVARIAAPHVHES